MRKAKKQVAACCMLPAAAASQCDAHQGIDITAVSTLDQGLRALSSFSQDRTSPLTRGLLKVLQA